MASLYYDLHIHSCLSPCGSEDMTPYNIAGMAALKGLDVIAVTDHNSCRNCPAVQKAAEDYGLIAIPGMELTTSEEVHAICLFETLEAALAFDAYVHERILPIRNKEEIFGRQEIYGLEDAVVGIEETLLISATSISFEGLWELVDSFGGVMLPAHVDKPANSLISNLGFVPEDSRFTAAELHDMRNLHGLLKQNPYLAGCRIISSSDAHYLEDIREPELTIEVKERSAAGVLEALRRKA
ncbi:MAG: PHP domain-containing protein [Clostridium sp.]|nr:PHP domain-containing protein [Clostridium sp.]